MSSDPWRLRCPNGHCAWRHRGDDYECEVCDERFDELTDWKAVDDAGLKDRLLALAEADKIVVSIVKHTEELLVRTDDFDATGLRVWLSHAGCEVEDIHPHDDHVVATVPRPGRGVDTGGVPADD